MLGPQWLAGSSLVKVFLKFPTWLLMENLSQRLWWVSTQNVTSVHGQKSPQLVGTQLAVLDQLNGKQQLRKVMTAIDQTLGH